MPLNDRQIKNAKPAEKPFKLNDGKGLYLIGRTGHDRDRERTFERVREHGFKRLKYKK